MTATSHADLTTGDHAEYSLDQLRSDIIALAEASRDQRLIAPDGKPQAWLIDLRPLCLNPATLRALAHSLWDLILQTGSVPDRHVQLAGMETAAIPLLSAMLLTAPDGITATGLIIRKERKTTGRAQALEGEVTGAHVILIDDIINSAASAEKARVVLAEAGVTPVALCAVIDYRSRRCLAWRQEHKLPVHALFTLDDLGLSLPPPMREAMTQPEQLQRFKLRWRAKVGEPYPFYVNPKSAPLLANGTLYLGTDEAAMVALDAMTGAEQWRFQARGAHRKGIWSSPALHAGEKNADALIFGAYNGDLYSLDAATGHLRWATPACEWIGSSPLIVPQHGIAIIGLEYERPAARGSMAAFRLSDGEKLWEYYLDSHQHGSAAYWAAGDLAICGTNDHSILALNASTGEHVWAFPTDRSVKYAPAIDQKRGLVVAASFDGNIYVLSAATGEKLAALQTDNICYTTPLIADGRIWCGSGDRHLYVIDLDTLTLVKKIDYGARIYASPKLIAGRIAFGTNAGVYREIDPVTCETLARIQLPDAITNAAAASDDGQVIYVATYTNEVFCLERE